MTKSLRLMLIILILCTALLLCACSVGDTGNDDNGTNSNGNSGTIDGDTDGLPDDNKPDEDIPEDTRERVALVRGGVAECQIVYPDGCESFVSDAAQLLARRIKNACDAEVTVCTDSESNGAKRIVLGKTEDDEIRRVFESMRYYDYGVSYIEDCILIFAHSRNGYIKAIEQLEKSFENDTDSGTLYVPKENFMDALKSSYDISSWQICGTELAKYRIVYEDGLDSQLVRSLRDKIAKSCGAYMDIVSDGEREACEYEILIGNTSRMESLAGEKPLPLHFTAEVIGSKLVIRSGGIHSLPRIFDSLFSLLTDGKSEINMSEGFIATGNIFSDTLDSSLAEGTDLRIMSCNILAEYLTWSADPEYEAPYLPIEIREEIFFAALDYYKPTVVGLQELSPAWYNAIENNYHDFERWELLKFVNPNRADGELVFSTVMYRKDLYTLTDSGMSFFSKNNNARGHCYTWAVLKEITTEREFCFVSTHWDGTGREHGFLQSREFTDFVNLMQQSYPVFTTGDFNSNELSPELIEFLENSGSSDAKQAALQQMNNVGSWHNLTKDNLSWGSCDHITSTKESTVLKFQTLYENEIIWGSDHCWLIADIRLGEIGEEA